MAANHDYIPARDADFDGWFENLKNIVVSKTGSGGWTHIPTARVTELASNYTAWHADHEKTLGPHTSVDIEEKNDRRKAAEGFIRPFVQQYLKFDPVTNEERTAMNLPNKDATRSPIGKPATRALITDLINLGGFQVEVRFQDEATPTSRAIPYGCNGCILNYTVGTEKVSDYGALKETKLMTHSPFTLTLGPEAEGKYFSAATRWQNEKGEIGDAWGDIQHIVVA